MLILSIWPLFAAPILANICCFDLAEELCTASMNPCLRAIERSADTSFCDAWKSDPTIHVDSWLLMACEGSQSSIDTACLCVNESPISKQPAASVAMVKGQDVAAGELRSTKRPSGMTSTVMLKDHAKSAVDTKRIAPSAIESKNNFARVFDEPGLQAARYYGQQPQDIPVPDFRGSHPPPTAQPPCQQWLRNPHMGRPWLGRPHLGPACGMSHILPTSSSSFGLEAGQTPGQTQPRKPSSHSASSVATPSSTGGTHTSSESATSSTRMLSREPLIFKTSSVAVVSSSSTGYDYQSSSPTIQTSMLLSSETATTTTTATITTTTTTANATLEVLSSCPYMVPSKVPSSTISLADDAAEPFSISSYDSANDGSAQLIIMQDNATYYLDSSLPDQLTVYDSQDLQRLDVHRNGTYTYYGPGCSFRVTGSIGDSIISGDDNNGAPSNATTQKRDLVPRLLLGPALAVTVSLQNQCGQPLTTVTPTLGCSTYSPLQTDGVGLSPRHKFAETAPGTFEGSCNVYVNGICEASAATCSEWGSAFLGLGTGAVCGYVGLGVAGAVVAASEGVLLLNAAAIAATATGLCGVGVSVGLSRVCRKYDVPGGLLDCSRGATPVYPIVSNLPLGGSSSTILNSGDGYTTSAVTATIAALESSCTLLANSLPTGTYSSTCLFRS